MGVFIFWAAFLDWLTFHSETIRRFVRPRPLPLVRDGVLLRHNLARELVAVEELKSLLRAQNVEDLATVKVTCMEPDGQISVTFSEARSRAVPGEQGAQERAKRVKRCKVR
ncbi:MAG: DUF421 domain-containing protein [Acidimicrobiia bacterium]